MGAYAQNSRINRTLISLKVVVFFVITGITALHILHATKPLLLGFNFDEYRRISIIAPFVSIIGPLIVGPVADRLAAKNANNFGRSLRLLTAILLILAAIIYACLFAVPNVKREEVRRPLVSFGCDANGAFIFQERCADEAMCHHWKSRKGTIDLTNCTYTCQDPARYENMYTPWLDHLSSTTPHSTEHSSEFDYDDDDSADINLSNHGNDGQRSRRYSASAVHSLSASRTSKTISDHSAEFPGLEVNSAEEVIRLRSTRNRSPNHLLSRARKSIRAAPPKIYVEPPHLCLVKRNSKGENVVNTCHVYTDDTKSILVNTVLRSAINIENDTHSAEWCNYPLDGFQCQIPIQQAQYMIHVKNGTDCKPMVECQVVNPYDNRDSVLSSSECMKITGDLDATLAGYMSIRILGDIFPMAALTLLNTAIVVAVRETSEGRGEICRQYAWGAVGYVLLISPLDIFFFHKNTWATAADVALILVIVCFVLGAIVLIFATNMPLSPPEWWWHTKTGMLVYPMSAIRKYGPEIFLLIIVCLLFGTFWSIIHSYLIWTFDGAYAAPFAGILLVLVLFLNLDKFIEYCGHSNIFIAGFAIFIIRFTALSCKETTWFIVLTEILEPVVIGIIWITVILYMRHVMPRKLTATGQAVAILTFFGLGKGFGALFGLVRDDRYPDTQATVLHEFLATFACFVAIIYFIIYNLILAPRCAAKPAHLDDYLTGSTSQTFANGAGAAGTRNAGDRTGMDSNYPPSTETHPPNADGYSPLRIYHNERGKKGQFRY